METRKRDTQLDNYRALCMIYVVCFIHMLYWLKIGTEPFMSIVLVEMPLIFFVSGAAFSLSSQNKSFWAVCKGRIKRVIIPYYIYALVMVTIVAILSIVWHYEYPRIIQLFGEKAASKYYFDITSYGLKDVLQIITCTNIPQSPCVWHLWFILPYLILSCAFNAQKFFLRKIHNRGGYCLACILAFLIVKHTTESLLAQNIFFYNIFMVIGYCYYKNISYKWITLTGILALFALLIGTLALDWKFCPMQSHKFPPDILFMVYNLLILCAISLVLGKIKLPQSRLLSLWNKRGYTIYLYQSIVYFMIFPIHLAFIQHIPSRFVQAATCMVILFGLSMAVSYVSYPLENLIMRHLYRKSAARQ